MSLDNFILECERTNKKLTVDLNYYKNCTNRLLRENQQLKEQLEQKENEIKELCKKIKVNEKSRRKMQKSLMDKVQKSEKARKEASNVLKDYIPDEYIRSCDTSDGIGRYELDTESWQYKIYEILDIDKGE